MSSAASVLASTALGRPASLSRLGYKSPNEKLNIAAIGAGGKGASDIDGCKSENIVALCDADWKNAAKTFAKYPNAKQYKDFRKMLDQQKDIDAVTISTPDHTHAVAAMWAMERGKHVYVQKPLTHSLWEARKLTEAARKYKVATQMGNQGHSNEGARQLCEMIWAGEIGNVKEVHAWTNRPLWPQGLKQAPAGEPVPDTFDWDVWLGPPASARSARNMLRSSGAASSILAAERWATWLATFSTRPTGRCSSVIRPASSAPSRRAGLNSASQTSQSFVSSFRPAATCHPSRSHGTTAERCHPGLRALTRTPSWATETTDRCLLATRASSPPGTYGERTRLLPDSRMKDYKFPDPFLSRSPGHYRDWIRACKGGEPACSNFDYAGPFTEVVLLGVIAQRFDGKLLWDGDKMKITNHSEANRRVKDSYRKGWKL